MGTGIRSERQGEPSGATRRRDGEVRDHASSDGAAQRPGEGMGRGMGQGEARLREGEVAEMGKNARRRGEG